jgi:NitT/TauT family transport system substrate-binding protein
MEFSVQNDRRESVRRGSVLLTALSLVILTACANRGTSILPKLGSDEATPTPMSIRLPMGFVANVQFAPVYVAVDKGYFAQEGIELEFDYSWETDGVRLVGSEELPFAIASGDQVLLARAQELPVLTVVNWWQRFPVSVVALEESGIQEPSDLVGQKLGTPETFGASYIGWRALAAANGLTDQDVQLEVIGYTQLANLTEGRVDAAVVYANNEPVQLEQMGYDFVEFPVSDYASLVSNGLISNEQTLEEQPELVRAFARAFLKGLEDTLNDPDAAFEICKNYVEGLEENEEAQRAVMDASLVYWRGEVLGRSEPEAWENTVEVMKAADLLQGDVDSDQAFTNDFLP